jgi:dTDP-4-amino-4,6-dideoxygalactose transaminase
MGRRWVGQSVSLPVTEAVSDRLVRLPLFHDMSLVERERVIAAVLDWRA